MKIKMTGLYIHIPFCVRKCKYCDFVSFPNGDYNEYLTALISELEEYKGTEADTVFIGGGTPSMLNGMQIERLFDGIRNNFKISDNAEISMELNPGTINAEKLAAMKNSGVNRVSIGVQSFNDRELGAIGRIHDSKSAVKAVWDVYNAGIENINIDLMTSIPYQTGESLLNSLNTAFSLPITHISAYSLILEMGTKLFEEYEAGKLELPGEEEDRNNFDMLTEKMTEYGFLRYEISNFAKTGFECRHNIKYWKCQSYIGAGLAAHSYLDGRRFYNTSDMRSYLNGDRRTDDVEILGKTDKISEFMFMGLRMCNGIGRTEFRRRFNESLDEIYGDKLKKFISMGVMEQKGDRYFLNGRGMNVSNSVMCEFLL